MNINDVGTQLLYVTTLIKTTLEDGSISGTGFFITYSDSNNNNIPLLVSNYHNVKNAKKVEIGLFSSDESGLPSKDGRKLITINKNELIYFDEKLDIIIIPIGPYINYYYQNLSTSFFYRSIPWNIFPESDKIQEFSAIEEIIFIGYPKSIIDKFNFIPLIRRGITATPIWNNFEENPNFVIDAGVYPGSSGSPIFIFNQSSYQEKENIVIGQRLYFVGILSLSYSFKDKNEDPKTFLGLGVALNCQAVKNFIENTMPSIASNYGVK